MKNTTCLPDVNIHVVGSSFSANAPKSQRNCTGDLPTTSWKIKLTGNKNTKVIREKKMMEQKWMEMSRQSERHTMRMKHGCDDMSVDPNLSQASDVIWTKNADKVKNNNNNNNKEERLTTKKLQCMMPSCRLASELRSQISQVFQVTSHIVGLVVLCEVWSRQTTSIAADDCKQ